MSTKPIGFIVVALFAVSLGGFIYWSMVSDGVPQIEAAVRREVVELSHSQAQLHTLQLDGASHSWHTRGDGGSLTGYFTYSGSYLGQSSDIEVSWSKADTNAPIDKIELVSASQEPKIIWSRK